MTEFNYGTGKRKTAVARTRVYPGTGQILINNRPMEEYFPRPSLQMIIRQPLVVTKTAGKFDIKVNICGGGISGQAAAVRHGISRALCEFDQDLRPGPQAGRAS